MKYAADFRSIARTALKGKWGIAVVAGLIASLLGAIGSKGPELNVELNDGNFNASLQILGQDVVSSNAGFEFWPVIAGIATYVAIFAIVFGIALFILGSAENPELTASEAIERSKQMMSGNRWRLFCLQFSFIGWDLLSALLTFGIGSLWITPYKQAATAAFYREISGTEYKFAQPEQPQV